MTEKGTQTVVVVGGGLAAGTVVTALREGGFDGRVVLHTSEGHPPYERPPLSKGYLMGEAPLDDVFVRPTAWYDEHEVDLRLDSTVTALDVTAREIVTASHHEQYDALVLATGSSPRRLPMADESGAPVAYLRTIEDSDRIRETLRPDASVVVVGGGWIGLEVAAAARTAGADVTVLESLDLPLLRVLGPEVAAKFAELHREHGVDLRTGSAIAAVSEKAGQAVVRLEDGATVTADVLVVGIGVGPNVRLAEQAGLRIDDGVVVDAHLRASVPGVYAAGDVARAHHPLLGRSLRVEHWDNAIGQGQVVARNLLGEDAVHDRLPYFFTDQYELGMEYVGDVGPDGYDDVVLRGDLGSGDGAFQAFWVREGSVVAAMHANDWDAAEHLQRLARAERVDLAALQDDSRSLAEVDAE